MVRFREISEPNFTQKAGKDFLSKFEKQSEIPFIKPSFKLKRNKSHFKYEWSGSFLNPCSLS